MQKRGQIKIDDDGSSVNPCSNHRSFPARFLLSFSSASFASLRWV